MQPSLDIPDNPEPQFLPEIGEFLELSNTNHLCDHPYKVTNERTRLDLRKYFLVNAWSDIGTCYQARRFPLTQLRRPTRGPTLELATKRDGFR
ncbi:unnamed protein product [Dibothriocephalus latus]|uniref:Uncharacterized protein n=1 Tax=Dibothriocephalus latus TaxID=60516 RepID=A0A3P6Q8B0_DIBLA|nr:unnamed protein product [Dibothriocephalus latus]